MNKVSQQDPGLVNNHKHHKDKINSAVYNHSGSQIASVGTDQILHILNKHKNNTIKLVGHSQEINRVVFTHSDQKIITCSKDNSIRIWDNNHQGNSEIIKGHFNTVRDIDISCDDNLLVSCSDDKTIRFHNLIRNKFIYCLKYNNWVKSVRFSNDARLVISGGDDKIIRINDIESRNTITQYQQNQMVHQVLWSPDQSAIGSIVGNQIKLFDSRSQKLLQFYDQPNINRIDYHPNSQYLVGGTNDGKVKIWDLRMGKLLYTLYGHKSSVNSVAFDTSGEHFVTAGTDSLILEWKFNQRVQKTKQQNDQQQMVQQLTQTNQPQQIQIQQLSNSQVNQTLDRVIGQLDIINNTLQVFENRISNTEEQLSSLNMIINEKLRNIEKEQDNLVDLNPLIKSEVQFQRAPNYN